MLCLLVVITSAIGNVRLIHYRDLGGAKMMQSNCRLPGESY